jgi:hypothetical protein
MQEVRLQNVGEANGQHGHFINYVGLKTTFCISPRMLSIDRGVARRRWGGGGGARVTKRCSLSWLTNIALVSEPKCVGGGGGGVGV